MKKLVVALLLFVAPAPMWAQEAEEQTDTETVFKDQVIKLSSYGSFMVDWGLSSLIRAPKKMEQNVWSSRALNGYFYYNIPIKASYFTISPGIGLGGEGYTFKDKEDKDKYTLVRSPGSRKTILESAKNLFKGSHKVEITKSSLNTRYVELVAELRFNTNHQEPQSGFFIAIGPRIGMRWGAATTIQYQEDGQHKSRTTSESFNLNKLRYGFIARIGWRRLGIFYAQTLSNLFNQDQGPSKARIMPFSVGASLNLF